MVSFIFPQLYLHSFFDYHRIKYKGGRVNTEGVNVKKGEDLIVVSLLVGSRGR